MKNELVIDIPEVIDKDSVKKRIQSVGVKSLNIEEADRLGLFDRLSVLICAMHSLTVVEQKLYGQIDGLLALAQSKKYDIKNMCNKHQKNVEEWFRFWRLFQSDAGSEEMSKEVEDLYNQFLRWTGIPKEWNLGDPQMAKPETEPMIVIERDDKIWRLFRDVAERETTEDEEDEWGVFYADREDGNRVLRCVEREMDKSSAQMSAKRWSVNNPENLYVVCLMKRVEEKRIDVIPHKAYNAGDMVGDVKKVRKR